MEKEFVPYELAVKLKELGFDEPCFGYYVDGELRGINLGIEELGGIEPYYQRFGFHTLSNHNIDNPNKIVVTAPTYSQALRWFREKYNIHSFIIPLIDEVGFVYKYQARVHTKESAVEIIGEFETYEEAEIACLENLIELVESKSE
jgi:hypothetical protein